MTASPQKNLWCRRMVHRDHVLSSAKLLLLLRWSAVLDVWLASSFLYTPCRVLCFVRQVLFALVFFFLIFLLLRAVAVLRVLSPRVSQRAFFSPFRFVLLGCILGMKETDLVMLT